jgi:hypothetical protein
MTRQSPKGPWLKVYVSALDTKAHYTDGQFRALIEVWMLAVRQPTRGLFPNRSTLDRRVGAESVDFLLSAGDIELLGNSSVAVHKWADYQSGVLSTERGSRSEGDGGEHVDNRSRTAPEQFVSSSLTRAGDALSLLPSKKTTEDEERIESGTRASMTDPIDAFYLTTGRFPSERQKAWIRNVAEKGPHLRDFGVVFAVEWRESGFDVKKALDATEGKLGQMLHRAEQAARQRKPSSSIDADPLLSEIKAAMTERYGAPETVVLPSPKSGQAQALTDDGTAGSTSPSRGPERGTPSPGAPAVRPPSSGPLIEASTDEAEGEP